MARREEVPEVVDDFLDATKRGAHRQLTYYHALYEITDETFDKAQIIAATTGDLLTFKWLVNNNKLNYEIYNKASMFGHLHIIEYALDKTKNSYDNSHGSMLNYICDAANVAAMCGQLDILKYLLNQQHVPIMPRHLHWCNLELALVPCVEHSDFPMLNYLLYEIGCDIGKSNRYVIGRSIRSGNIPMFEYLLDIGYTLPDKYDLYIECLFFDQMHVVDYLHRKGYELTHHEMRIIINSCCSSNMTVSVDKVHYLSNVSWTKTINLDHKFCNIMINMFSYDMIYRPKNIYLFKYYFNQLSKCQKFFVIGNCKRFLIKQHHANCSSLDIFLEIEHKRLTSENNLRKNNLLKFVLRPKSLHLQFTACINDIV
jgi:hypothetical protein